jgi:hypothetical protein
MIDLFQLAHRCMMLGEGLEIRLAENLKDPQIKKIRLYDLRQYFCSHHYTGQAT